MSGGIKGRCSWSWGVVSEIDLSEIEPSEVGFDQ